MSLFPENEYFDRAIKAIQGMRKDLEELLGPEETEQSERQCDDNYPFKVIEDGLEEDNDG